ncbi:HpcH/HpaI aldolase/citrate lyase family protein [Gordonia sp. CPCC 205515]|uniref:HpcH/HpaI aldolase/citrate lyase family protein n=1 Tax=Gordonia sp. CPCC 205515 TaxID=3140791 RepID=UPI003AF36036
MTITAPADDATGLGRHGVRQFHHLDAAVANNLFCIKPEYIPLDAPRDRLALALGATLYIPGTRPDLADTIARRHAEGVTSMVIDLEDAVADEDERTAIDSAVAALRSLAHSAAASMLLFVRTRRAEQIISITTQLGSEHALNGFVLPKFGTAAGHDDLAAIAEASSATSTHLFAMPVLESRELVHRETRDEHLAHVASTLADFREHILAVRLGATDICGLFGIRRDRDLTIYDVRVAADVIADVVNYLGRCEDSGHVVTGPVWEYFADHERLFRPTLRQTPFREHDAVMFRQQLVSRDMDGLLREIALDRANGIHGKTVIHPAHVAPVHALSAVTHEEYHDACDILAGETGGVRASSYGNKMNELKPHRNWARRVMDRAAVFGVTRQGIDFVDLLTALADR